MLCRKPLDRLRLSTTDIVLIGLSRYIHKHYPELRTFAELKRDPHILGWLQSLSETKPDFVHRHTPANRLCVCGICSKILPIAHIPLTKI